MNMLNREVIYLPREKSSQGSYEMPEAVVEKSELKEMLEEALELFDGKGEKVVLLYYLKTLP